jgi:hypothetical protein
MSKRPTAEQIQRLLREADRDPAKVLTAVDMCRKLRDQLQHLLSLAGSF